MAIRHVLSLVGWLLLFSIHAHALPFDSADLTPFFTKRGPVIHYDGSGNVVNVTDSSTADLIAQGPASDGGGFGFDAPAVIWLVWSLVVGTYLTFAGFSLWRPTTGIAIGTAGVVCVWAAFANTISAEGISDLLLTLIVMGAFLSGFTIGVFDVGRLAGITLLGILAGFSVGVRLVLFRANLLIPIFYVNWVIITIFGLAGLFMIMISHRIAIISSAVAIGTFLFGLGIDLGVNKQSGMSRGLRYLFDRNSAHVQDIIGKGYHPPIVTIAILAVSLAAIPAFAYGQNIVFTQPFKRRRTYSRASRGSMDSTAPAEAEVDTATSTVSEDGKLAVEVNVGSVVTLNSSASSKKLPSLPELSEK